MPLFFYAAFRSARLASFRSFHISLKLPTNQYGTTKVNKKIISQKPMVRMVKNAKKPKYWSNSNIVFSFGVTKISQFDEKKQICPEKSAFTYLYY